MNLYLLLGILVTIGFVAWRLYAAGAKNKATSIERDSLEDNLGVEHAIREELLEKTREQKKEMDVVTGSFKSARDAWLRNKDNPSNS